MGLHGKGEEDGRGRGLRRGDGGKESEKHLGGSGIDDGDW